MKQKQEWPPWGDQVICRIGEREALNFRVGTEFNFSTTDDMKLIPITRWSFLAQRFWRRLTWWRHARLEVTNIEGAHIKMRRLRWSWLHWRWM